MKHLIMCEVPNELEIIRMLLEHDKLIFTEDDLLVNMIKRYKQLKGKHQKDELYLADLLK